MTLCPCFGVQDHLTPVFSHFSAMKSDEDEEEEQPPLLQLHNRLLNPEVV